MGTFECLRAEMHTGMRAGPFFIGSAHVLENYNAPYLFCVQYNVRINTMCSMHSCGAYQLVELISCALDVHRGVARMGYVQRI